MADPSRPPRVLQLIGDTDVTGEHVAALALHRALQGQGLQVRTLALAPGRTGGLESDVPAIAPARRSLAARGQVVKESRWADVVVLHAPRALTMATAPSRGGAPVIVALWQDPAGSQGHATRVQRRIAAAAAAVVAPSAAIADALQQRLDVATSVQVIAADLDDPGRPVVDGPAWARLLGDSAR